MTLLIEQIRQVVATLKQHRAAHFSVAELEEILRVEAAIEVIGERQQRELLKRLLAIKNRVTHDETL